MEGIFVKLKLFKFMCVLLFIQCSVFAGAEKVVFLGVDSENHNRIEVRFTHWDNPYYIDKGNEMFQEYFTLLCLAKAKNWRLEWRWGPRPIPNSTKFDRYIKYLTTVEE